MVVPLGPGKFCGTSLRRPWIYDEVKFNSERVDPPVPVSDPLMSWSREAHWSMGGLTFKRFRLQGSIESNVIKLRLQRDKFRKKQNRNSVLVSKKIGDLDNDFEADYEGISPSPPPAPIAMRRRFTTFIDEEDVEDIDLKRSVGGEIGGRKRLVRNLGDDFDRVAAMETGFEKSRESPVWNLSGGLETVASRTRSRKSKE